MKRYLLVIALSFLVFSLIATPASATIRKTGSQGDYFPLTFYFADGDVPALIDVASINVLFDPPGFSYNQKEDLIAKATPWKHHDIQGLDAPTLEFTSGEPYRMEMDLFFDRYEEGKSVREYTDKIEKLAVVVTEKHRPPTCLVTWGLKTYECEIEKAETKFIQFFDDGTSAKAIMRIIFNEFSPVVEGGRNDGPHKRPGPAKYSIALPPSNPTVEPPGPFISEEQQQQNLQVKITSETLQRRLEICRELYSGVGNVAGGFDYNALKRCTDEALKD